MLYSRLLGPTRLLDSKKLQVKFLIAIKCLNIQRLGKLDQPGKEWDFPLSNHSNCFRGAWRIVSFLPYLIHGCLNHDIFKLWSSDIQQCDWVVYCSWFFYDIYICILDVIFKLFIPTQDQNHPKFKGEKQSYLKFGGFGPSWFINVCPQKLVYLAGYFSFIQTSGGGVVNSKNNVSNQ